MGLTADTAGLRKLRKSLESLARPGGAGQMDLLGGIRNEVRGVLREEFSEGIDPSGAAWPETVRGKQALESRKLANAFTFTIEDGSVTGVGKSKRDMLEAHQQGHEFPARSVGGGQNYLSFNRKGKLIRNSRILNKKGEVRRGAYQVFAKAHTVTARKLPQRRIIPENTLPPRWEKAIARGALAGMQRWAARAEK